jgi:formylglycine-generating enzyme required for sulfatase activity
MFRQVSTVALVFLTALGSLSVAAAQERGSAKAPPPAVAPFTAAAAREHQEAWAKHIGQPREVTNSIGMKLALIPPGEFRMGSQEPAEQLVKAFAAYHRAAQEFDDEYPQHRVRITRPFYLGAYAVTVGQFRRFAEDANYKTEAEKDGQGGWGYNPEIQRCEGRKPQFNWRNPGFKQTDNQPVLNITWNDAVVFCQWVGHKEGGTYRLPTEAEWEYACRAGTTTRYFNGDDPDNLAKVAKVMEDKGRSHFPAVQNLVIAKDTGDCFTVPVGSFPPNAFGLYDMHGNVWQWCSDWYGADYYSKSPTDDPQGPESGDRRVRRGGAWNSFPLWPRASFRNYNTPVSRCVNLGFRVARNP